MVLQIVRHYHSFVLEIAIAPTLVLNVQDEAIELYREKKSYTTTSHA